MVSTSAVKTDGIGGRIRQFRQSMPGIATQSSFSHALNVDQQRLSGYENGTKVPHNVIATIVRLGANPYWLLFGEGQMRTNSQEGEQWRGRQIRAIDVSGRANIEDGDAILSEFYVLPLYANETVAGIALENRNTEVEGPAIIHRAWCQHPEFTDYVRVVSTEHSMEPVIPAGSMVTIDLSITEPHKLDGKIVAIRILEGDVVIRRLRHTERGQFIGVPDNPSLAYQLITINEGDVIIGQVQTVHARLY